ncbi:serine hydrolase domain-containing protein [Pseudalkalibacillus salsuginis]|uniref:serine hydrolase domain-containing protein n=1 Tax=Pseudalkalibacillus salsuginis TaxID=2910972 RepID=UPI001F3ECB9C|nr:serine hydrolase [Pseudalkalibacillus salsuginis]MCF6411667.1 beta-lactamase family protein [Pseudalkalibacillus salsuginis]
MVKNDIMIEPKLKQVIEDEVFSGTIHMKRNKEDVILLAAGYANRSEEKKNELNTRFGIASGCKLFTAVAIGQLVEKGVISFESSLKDCLDIEFPNFATNITIHHLLTHSAGIPDYFDEAEMDDFEDLWKQQPMYLLRNLKDFVPMFQEKSMVFNPGEKFHYNNAGFILLGLIIEHKTGLRFIDYIETNIFKRCNMHDSGYFSMDQLPKNTASGYIEEEDGTWRTNVYSIPVIGGSDGGAYVTAPDMNKFWEGLLNNMLLEEPTKNMLLEPHIQVKQEVYYGYGIWINKRAGEISKYHVMGYDPGVSFHSVVYPNPGIILTISSNKSKGPFKIMKFLEDELILI